jgi:hypothetical protein
MATVRIWRSGERKRATSVSSRGDGRFRVRLPPGTYTVEATAQRASPLPRPPSPLQVQVGRGRFTAITITYDTGIR